MTDKLLKNTGASDADFNQIVELFNEAQSRMFSPDQPVSNIFCAPNPKEVVRLNQKSNKFFANNGWLSKVEAEEEVGAWKNHAANQYFDPVARQANSQKIVLSLFDLSGAWSQPWADAGYQVFKFDIQDDAILGDINNFNVEFFNEIFGDFEGLEVYAILAACPCTDFAVSGARHFAAKDADGRTLSSVELVHQTIRTIEYFKPSIWAIENPVGRIERLGGLAPWRLSFDPFHFGDTYTKKTLLWGRFNADLPIAPVEPIEGSKMHKLYGGKSLATKNARSVTPEGFAYSFFMANNAFDHPVMAVSNKYDRLDETLISAALNAGISEECLSAEIDDAYYMDMNDQTANALIRELTKKYICQGQEHYYVA